MRATSGIGVNVFGPNQHDTEADRFPEGFSIFIASGALIGLWETGSLKLPGGFIADVAWLLLVALGIFGIYWAIMGLTDRYQQS